MTSSVASATSSAEGAGGDILELFLNKSLSYPGVILELSPSYWGVTPISRFKAARNFNFFSEFVFFSPRGQSPIFYFLMWRLKGGQWGLCELGMGLTIFVLFDFPA